MTQFLVEDIRKSLLARLELLLDDLDNDASEKECLQLLEESLGVLPKRVFFPAVDAILLCDYTFPDEMTTASFSFPPVPDHPAKFVCLFVCFFVCLFVCLFVFFILASCRTVLKDRVSF